MRMDVEYGKPSNAEMGVNLGYTVEGLPRLKVEGAVPLFFCP